MRLSELQHTLPALSDAEKAALAETLSALPEAPRRASRRMRLIPALALLLLLLAALGCAAAREPILNWLLGFGASNEALDALVQPLDDSTNVNGVTVSLTGAVCDGRQLVLAYSLENARPETPVYVSVRAVRVNGVDELRLDSASADEEALPVPFTSFQDPDSDEPTTENPVARGVSVALTQPLEAESASVEIEFALLRAVTDGDEPALEPFAVLTKATTVSVNRATLDLAPDAPIALDDCDTVFTRFALSPLSTRLDFALIPRENTREAAETLAETYGEITLCDAEGQPVAYLDMDWLSSGEPQVETRDGQWRCAYSVDMPGLADTPDVLCLRVQGKGEAAETFNQKMAFPTRQESQHMN